MIRGAFVLAILSILASGLGPGRALAVGEEEWQLAVMAGYGRLFAGADQGGGALARLEGQRGLTDALAIHATLGPSQHARAGGALAATAGVTYAVDVLRVVPFFEGGLAFVAGAGRDAVGLELGAGGEYLIDRRWAVALVARYALLPLRLRGPSGGSPLGLLSVGVRVGRVF
jgi:hypothetical protein